MRTNPHIIWGISYPLQSTLFTLPGFGIAVEPDPEQIIPNPQFLMF
jgi:hypothetical protein